MKKIVKCLSFRIITVLITRTVDRKSTSFFALNYLVFLFKWWKKTYSVDSWNMIFTQKALTWRFWAVSLKDDFRMLLGYNVMLIFRPVKQDLNLSLEPVYTLWNAAAFAHCAISSFAASQINAELWKVAWSTIPQCFSFSQIIYTGLTWFREI